MPNLNIAILGSLEYAKNFGKKSTETDITFYDYKKGSTTLTMIEPSRYPEKLSSLSYAAGFGDYTIFVVEKLDQFFGENLLMLDAFNAKNGLLILNNYITIDQVAKFIKGTVVEGYKVMPDDPIQILDEIISLAEKPRKMLNLEYGTVIVDHCFNVRGIGTIALGVVQDGMINVHDVLKILPGISKTEVRSIQKHDDDFDSAEAGDRVGIALKGVEVETVPRGTILTNDNNLKTTGKCSVEVDLNPFWQNPPHEGMVVQIGLWMQFNLARIINSEATPDKRKFKINIEMDKPLIHPPKASAALMYMDGGKLRVMGTIKLP